MLQTRKCLDEIADLFESGPTNKSQQLLDRVVDLYFLTVDQQSTEDRDTFGDVLTRMVFDVDGLTRARLAERMSKEKNVPLELLRRLACDEIIVARPILETSPCLREGDIIAIVEQVSEEHMIAIAHRHELMIPVTDLLVERGTELVHIAMARNMGAQFSTQALVYLVDAAQSCSDIRLALDLRRDLTPSLITRLKRLAEAQFWQRMAVFLLMTEVEYVDAVAEKPTAPVNRQRRDDPISAEPSSQSSDDAVDSNPDDVIRSIVSEQELVGAAKAGEIETTLEYFSVITRLNQPMIKHCLFEAHITALMVLCKANKLARGTFSALLLLRENHTGQATDDTVGLMRRYDGMTPETALRIIRFSDNAVSLPMRKARRAAKRTSLWQQTHHPPLTSRLFRLNRDTRREFGAADGE